MIAAKNFSGHIWYKSSEALFEHDSFQIQPVSEIKRAMVKPTTQKKLPVVYFQKKKKLAF